MAIDLDSKEVYKVLRNKGLKFFYHANTVKTTITFLKENGLLSRGFVERNGLPQTPQSSDDTDKKLGIWDFIFLDSNDLGSYFDRPNVYGPILLSFSNDILLRDSIPTVRITKFNPCYWTEKSAIEDCYFTDIEDYDKSYMTGNKLRDGGIMFLLTTSDGKLDFSNTLIGIQVDNPGISFINKDKSSIKIADAIKRRFYEEIDPNTKRKLLFKIRDLSFFRNLYLWKYQKNRADFKRLFYP